MKENSHILTTIPLHSTEALRLLHYPPSNCYKYIIFTPFHCNAVGSCKKAGTAATPDISDSTQHSSQGSK